MNKHELKNIELVEENGQYYLSVVYELEDDARIEELTIPRIRIPFNKHAYPVINNIACGFNPEWEISTGCDNDLPIKPTKYNAYGTVAFISKVIKEKAQEMTMAEIEKKLGYKVKIVSEGKR